MLDFFMLQKLSNIKADSTRFISANLPCNKHKNRLVHILPFESTRVCLTPVRAIEGSDYINASFIDGYRYRGAYIATQGPLLDTTEDFWRMLWEHNSTIVVMLTKLKEMGRVSTIYMFHNVGDDLFLWYICPSLRSSLPNM
jgi:netrin-G3 ligand